MTIHASPTSQRGVDDIGATVQITDVAALPLAPKNPLPYRQRLRALRVFHIGQETVRDAGGPVTRVSFGPKWLFPPVVVATSPKAARDVLGRKDAFVDKHIVHREMRQLLGENLFDLLHEKWLPRRRALQPIFTKQHVRAFGGHMSQAAEMVANRWCDGAEVDLDAECRRLTLRALGRHPDLQDRVAAQVTDIGDRELTPDDVPRLGYTIQVLHEALRLCPPAAAIGRMATRDIEVDGYRVQAGTMLAVGIYALHRDPALWDNPLAFDPDRFSPETPRAATAGNSYPSAPAHDPASATTSPCSKPPSRWPPSFAGPKSFRWTTFPVGHAVHDRRRSTDPCPRKRPDLTLGAMRASWRHHPANSVHRSVDVGPVTHRKGPHLRGPSLVELPGIEPATEIALTCANVGTAIMWSSISVE